MLISSWNTDELPQEKGYRSGSLFLEATRILNRGLSQGSTESHPTVAGLALDASTLFNDFPRMAGGAPYDDIGRKHPARGVHIFSNQSTIVFLTVCTENRNPWLANAAVHEHLRAASQSAEAWLVGYYLLSSFFVCTKMQLAAGNRTVFIIGSGETKVMRRNGIAFAKIRCVKVW